MFLSLAVFATIAGAVILMLKAWHRAWWAKVWVRRTTKLFFILGLLGIALRALGMSQAQEPAGRMPTLTIAGAALLGPVSVFALMLFLSLPAAALLRALLHGVERLLRLRKGAFEETPSVEQPAQVEEPGRAPERVARVSLPTESTVAASDPEASPSSPPSAPPPLLVPRRSLLEGAVIALPTLALAAGVLGIAGAYERTRIVPRPMAFPTLPPDRKSTRLNSSHG